MRDERLEYQRWVHRRTPSVDVLARQRLAAQRLAHRPLISIITPVYNTPPDFLRRLLASVRHQTYPFWEHCLVDDGSSEPWLARRLEREAARDPRVRFLRREANGGIATASNDALALATGEFVAFVDHDDEIEPDALYEIARAINAHPDADVLYTDFDVIDSRGLRSYPAFWPAWSPERLLSLPYIVHLRVVRRSLVLHVGGLRPALDGAQDYDLMLRITEQTDHVVHVPGVYYHWRISRTSAAWNPDAKPFAYEAGATALRQHLARIGLQAVRAPGPVEGFHHVCFDRAALSPVSLIAALPPPCSGDVARAREALTDCLVSLAGNADVPLADIVIAAPDREHDTVRSSLAALPPHLLRLVSTSEVASGGEGSLAASCAGALNAAARHATGDVLVFLGESLEALSRTWLSELAGYAQQTAVAAVGPKIYAPTGEVEHAGIVIPRRRPHPAHRGTRGSFLRYYGVAEMVGNYSAVSGACLVTRRALFAEVGGFRPASEVGYSDVDYCLRLRERGYRVVVSGYAELRQIQPPSPARADVEEQRLAAFRRTWPMLPDVDPYYNPNFDQESGSFLLADE